MTEDDRTVSTSLRARLLSVGESFVGFDRALQEEARRRAVKEQQALLEADQDMNRINDDLKVEIRARVEDIRNLQFFAQSAANAMLESLQESTVSRLKSLAGKIDKLSSRIVTLERGMQQFRGDLPSKLLVDTAALVKETSDARAFADELRDVSVKRNAELVSRLAEVSNEISRKSDSTLNLVDHQVAAILVECQELMKPHELSSEEKFREFSLNEFAAVKAGVQLESEARQKSDNEILEAIKFYSDTLNQSIRGIN